jgi:uncharacterized protein YgbK (DUF1537 family)
MMAARILILADDLSGAADCAVACHRAGMTAKVCLDPQALRSPADALAIDLDTRPRSPAEAWALTLSIRTLIEGRTVYRKIDSTLRGHVALEIAATLEVAGPGRTVVGGCIFVNGQPLADTEIWQRSGRGGTRLETLLADAGLAPEGLSLEQVRDGGLRAAIEAARARGARAVVCDAETDADLHAIVEASLGLPGVLWAGSGGLTVPLARALSPRREPEPYRVTRRPGPNLVVVGSASSVSRGQLALLADDPRAHLIAVPPRVLLEGPDAPGWRPVSRTLVAAVGKAGKDTVIVAIDPAAPVEPAVGPALAAALGRLAGRQLGRFGSLTATGGETARLILGAVGAKACCIRQEIEPGVVLSTVDGLPVVTKAGAFGDPQSLARALDALRALPLA